MTQDALAAKIGRDKGFVSTIISGKRNASVATLQRIADALGIKIADLFDDQSFPLQQSDHGPGFGESNVAPFLMATDDGLHALLRRCAPDVRHIATYQVTRSQLGFGYLAGDILAVELNGTPQTGHIVLATIGNAKGNVFTTQIRRLTGPWLLSHDPSVPAHKVDPDDQRVGIMGIVHGSIRGLRKSPVSLEQEPQDG